MVDDDSRIVRTTCDILKIKGFEAIPASSGEDGVAKAVADRPDCVLMDIKMPGINGVEAMKLMKEMVPGLPVVLVSAYATDEVMAEAKRVGAYAVLSKPLNFPAILAFLSLLDRDESILVIDDGTDYSNTLRDVLALRGYHIETESEPRNVLRHLEKERKMAVLLDLSLAESDGDEVLQKIQARYPTMPVVLVTGNQRNLSDSTEKLRNIGAYACLYKPFEMEQLLGLFEEIRLAKAKTSLIDDVSCSTSVI